MTTALLNRLKHHCHIIETGNDSFRFKHSTTHQREDKTGKKNVNQAIIRPHPRWVIIEFNLTVSIKLGAYQMGFKAFHSASATLAGIETAHMISKGQFANNQLPAYQQFIRLLYSHVDNWQLQTFTNICDKTRLKAIYKYSVVLVCNIAQYNCIINQKPMNL